VAPPPRKQPGAAGASQHRDRQGPGQQGAPPRLIRLHSGQHAKVWCDTLHPLAISREAKVSRTLFRCGVARQEARHSKASCGKQVRGLTLQAGGMPEVTCWGAQ